MTDLSAVERVLTDAVRAGAFPGAVVEVGTSARRVWQAAVGKTTADEDAAVMTLDTIFDLASLTKVMATTTLAMRAVDGDTLELDEPLARRVARWRGPDRAAVTVRDLLEHASGLTAHLPFFRDYTGRPEFEHAIASMPLEYPPRTRSVYSDLGFILLGFLLEDIYGQSLALAFETLVGEFDWGEVGYRPPPPWRDRAAPTEVDPWRGRLLVGEVHDENAWALGGIAGHAGLFGTADAVGRFCRAIAAGLKGDTRVVSPATLATFMAPSTVPGSSRALGWDTMRPTSSCGPLMSPRSVGHTGFTGTSLWIDPQRDLYVVFLTNRVHPSRRNDAILEVRPALHDAVIRAVG